MTTLWRKFMCAIGRHKSLDIINDFGSAYQVGCPHCRRMFGMHHGTQSFIGWDGELKEMYERFGYDVLTNERKWKAYLAQRETT